MASKDDIDYSKSVKEIAVGQGIDVKLDIYLDWRLTFTPGRDTQ